MTRGAERVSLYWGETAAARREETLGSGLSGALATMEQALAAPAKALSYGPTAEALEELRDPRYFAKRKRGKAYADGIGLPRGVPVDAEGRVVLSPELIRTLYYGHGRTLPEIDYFSGWGAKHITSLMDAWGMERRTRFGRGQGKGRAARSDDEAAAPLSVEAPDGTQVRLDSLDEVKIFKRTVKNYQVDYADWQAPEKQLLKGLALLDVGIHRLSEQARRAARDPETQGDLMKQLASLVKEQRALQTEMGMSRKQRQAAKETETATDWLNRVMQDFVRHEETQK